MYLKLDMTENTLRVLSLFTSDFTRDYYVREVGRLLDISPRTSQLVLENLEKKGIIKSKIRGKIKNYKLHISESTKKYLVFVEHYKAISFLEEHLIIKEIIEKITPTIEGIGVIFGSYVKGVEKKSSDLDIFIAGKYNRNEIRKISLKFGIDISIKCYPLKLFEKKLNEDILIKEIFKNHVVFINAEQFIKMVFKNG
jgi:uncharacterized protein